MPGTVLGPEDSLVAQADTTSQPPMRQMLLSPFNRGGNWSLERLGSWRCSLSHVHIARKWPSQALKTGLCTSQTCPLDTALSFKTKNKQKHSPRCISCHCVTSYPQTQLLKATIIYYLTQFLRVRNGAVTWLRLKIFSLLRASQGWRILSERLAQWLVVGRLSSLLILVGGFSCWSDGRLQRTLQGSWLPPKTNPREKERERATGPKLWSL